MKVDIDCLTSEDLAEIVEKYGGENVEVCKHCNKIQTVPEHVEYYEFYDRPGEEYRSTCDKCGKVFPSCCVWKSQYSEKHYERHPTHVWKKDGGDIYPCRSCIKKKKKSEKKEKIHLRGIKNANKAKRKQKEEVERPNCSVSPSSCSDIVPFSSCEKCSESFTLGVIIKILRQLSNEKKIGTEDTIWTDGEFDSNQTEFEKKSNYLEIGVLANSKRKAVVCLKMLRTIVDGYEFLYYTMELLQAEEKQFTLSKLIEYLFDLDDYVRNHQDREKVTADLVKCKDGKIIDFTIETCAKKMDLWSLDRLLSHFETKDIAKGSVTLKMTPKQLKVFLDQFVCPVLREQAEKEFLTFKSSGKLGDDIYPCRSCIKKRKKRP